MVRRLDSLLDHRNHLDLDHSLWLS
jgi:hypothetical protein